MVLAMNQRRDVQYLGSMSNYTTTFQQNPNAGTRGRSGDSGNKFIGAQAQGYLSSMRGVILAIALLVRHSSGGA